MKKHSILLTLLIVCSTLTVCAQVASRYVCVNLQTGLQRCGYLVEDNGREITLETESIGKVILLKENIVSIIDAEEGTEEENAANKVLMDRMTNPNRTIQPSRYFFAPSAYSLKKNEGYGSLNVTGANLSYGFSDQTMLGMSASIFGAGLNFKQSIPLNENLHASIGGMLQISWVGESPIIFPYFNITKGNENNHVTVNLGVLSQLSTSINSPMVNVSGTVKLNNKLSLISENYYFVSPEFFEVNTVLSIGMRNYGVKKNRLTDFALMMLVEPDEIKPRPWLGFTWPF